MPRLASEYAAISPTMTGNKKSPSNEEDDDDGTTAAAEMIDKITAKYDSLERLRGSLEENVDLNEEDDVTNGNNRCQSNINIYRWNEESGIPSEQEMMQVESFFSGHKTSVYVCPSMTSVYFSSSSVESTQTLPSFGRARCDVVGGGGKYGTGTMPAFNCGWSLAHYGIPLLLLDTGETRSRLKRGIQIVVAERGTGFLLWKDTIDNLTNYQAVDSHFHTMYMSCDHRKLVGLSFHSSSGAREFYEKVEKLTSDPANISLSSPNSKAAFRKKQKQMQQNQQHKINQKRQKSTKPKKADISQPCCFQHVTRLEMADRDYYVTLATLTGQLKQQHRTDEQQIHKYKSEPTLRINHI
ncbi:hypothetical protein CHUAL_000224 [Chamberlinius hualienensis]